MSDSHITVSEHPTPHDAVGGDHAHSDTVEMPIIGSVTLPGGIYSVVFVGLAILTLIEVAIAEILKHDLPAVKGLLLLGLAFVKAFLVAYFYMHLRKDSRIFAIAIMVPMIIVILCLLYLIFVPSTGGGLGYPELTTTLVP